MSFLRKILMLLNREVPTEALIKRGMKVGTDFNRQQGCFLDPSHCFLITIGNDVTMSIRVTVMAHDASTKKTLGYTPKLGRFILAITSLLGPIQQFCPVLPSVTML